MRSRVSFLHGENQLTKAPRLPIVMFRVAHAVLFTFAPQRDCGDFKSCVRNSRPGSRTTRAEGGAVTAMRPIIRDFPSRRRRPTDADFLFFGEIDLDGRADPLSIQPARESR